MDDGNVGIPFAKGQVEIKRSGMREELDLPLSQAKWLAIVGVIALLVLIADSIVVGPASGVVAGLLAIGALWWIGLRYIGHWWATIGVLLLSAIWLMYGYGLVMMIWPPLELNLPGWAVASVILISLPVLAACGLALYRMAYEIVDPNWPPTLSSRPPEAGIAWPGHAMTNSDAQPSDEDNVPETTQDNSAEIRALLLQLIESSNRPVRDRLVLVNGHSQPEQKLEIFLEEIDGEWHAYLDGKTPVKVETLKQFVRHAERITHGTSFRTAHALIGWGEETWRSALALLEVLGIVQRAGEKRASALLMSADDALAILDGTLSGAPSPTESDESQAVAQVQ